MIDKAELKIGAYIYFGSKSSPSAKEGQTGYPYVDPKSCYYKWKILDIKDNKLLLWGDGLDLEYGGSCSWRESRLRKYLNNNFISERLTENEQKLVCLTNSSGLMDRVFILSADEIIKYSKVIVNENVSVINLDKKREGFSDFDFSSDNCISRVKSGRSFWIRDYDSNKKTVCVGFFNKTELGILYSGEQPFTRYTNYIQCGEDDYDINEDNPYSYEFHEKLVFPAVWLDLNSPNFILLNDIDKRYLHIGDCVSFKNFLKSDNVFLGKYYQDDNNSMTPISWKIIEIKGNCATIIANNSLEFLPYNDSMVTSSLSWENCSLRKWLNNSFINKAFTKLEKECLLPNEDSDLVSILNAKEVIDIGDTSLLEIDCKEDNILKKYYWGYDHKETKYIYSLTKGKRTSYMQGWVKVKSTSTKGGITTDGKWCDWLSVTEKALVRPVVKIDLLVYMNLGHKVEEEKIRIENEERLLREKREEERRLKMIEEQKIAEQKNLRRRQGVCQYCGGKFKGLFFKKCSICGKAKDY